MNSDWKSYYNNHLTTAHEAVKQVITPDAHLVLGHAAATVDSFMEAMYDLRDELPHFSIFHVLYFGCTKHFLPEMAHAVSPKVNFMEAQARKACATGAIEFLPCHFHEVPALFRDGFYPVDVAVVQLSTPNEEGYCSFGISCDYTKPAVDCARVVVAEINPQMPFIGGDNLVHITKIDHIIEVDHPMIEVKPTVPGELEMQIGDYCASLIKDGDTLQLGIGAIPDAVLSKLTDRKNLGIHTEMFTDGVMDLIQSGVINGKSKTLHPEKVVSAFVMGSQKLYDFINNNPMIELYSVDYTNDPFVVGQNDNMVSINSCLEIDLLGQVNAESIGYKMFSGSGGQVDFLRGAKRSKQGRSIIALPSTAKEGTISRIVPILSEGSVVTTGRNDVDYVITEYGIARLRGKGARERAKALIQIAHPKFREQLTEQAAQRYSGFTL